MAGRSSPGTIDEYIAAAPSGCQSILEKIRTIIRRTAPRAEETISYGMPAFKQQGILVYFGAFKKHVGLFPPVRGDEKLRRAAAPFGGPRGNLKFPLEKPIPYDLIRRIVKARVLAIGDKSW